METKWIDIVFDGPPSHESGRFVEVEDQNKHSINFGDWVERDDGYWALRINSHDALTAALDQCVEALAMFLPPRCQAQYVGSPNFNAGKPCGLCAYCKATAALELAKKARG